MTPLSRRHLQFLVVDEVIGSTIINFVLNGAIAWFGVQKVASVPLWGLPGIAADTVATAFVLPVLTALSVQALVHLQVVRKLLPPLPEARLGSSALSRRSWFQRGAFLGGASIVLAAVPVIAVFSIAGPPQLAAREFIWFKAIFAAALGALVTPLLGWWALQDASRAKSRAP